MSTLFLFLCLLSTQANAQDGGPPQPPGIAAGGAPPQPPATSGGGGGGGGNGGYQQPQPQQYGGGQQRYGGGQRQVGGGQRYGGGSKNSGGDGGFAPPPSFIAPPPAAQSCELDPTCWQYAVECSAADVFPFERHSCGSCEECLDLCMKNQAKGGGLGTPLGLQAGAAGGCGGGCQQPQPQPCGGGGGCPVQQASYGGCGQQPASYGGGGSAWGRHKRQSGCGSGPCPYYCKSVVFDAQYKTCDLFAVNAPKLRKYPGRAYFQSTGLCSAANKTIGTTPAPSKSFCPSNLTTINIISPSFYLTTFKGQEAPGVTTRDACAQACLKGQLPDGTPMICASAQFADGKCVYTSEATEPANPGDFIKRSDATYMKISCFPKDLVKDCALIWEDAALKVLVGQNRLTTNATSYDDCIEQCLAQTEFKCKSGMVFVQDPKFNCILNVESKSTRPELFVDAPAGELMVYFETFCGGATAAPGRKKSKTLADALQDIPLVGEWTLWSPCEATWLNQVRYRQCRELDPRKCEKEERSCDPDKRASTTAVTEDSEESSTTEEKEMTKSPSDSSSKHAMSKDTTSKTSSSHAHSPTTPKVAPVLAVNAKGAPPMVHPMEPTSTSSIEEEHKEAIGGRLVENNNEVRRADAVEDGVCRALVKNGVKNCHLGVRLVGGSKRFCSNPSDC